MFTTLAFAVLVAFLTLVVTAVIVESCTEDRFRRHVGNLQEENDRLVAANTHHLAQRHRVSDRYHTVCDVAEASRDLSDEEWEELADVITDKIFDIDTRGE